MHWYWEFLVCLPSMAAVCDDGARGYLKDREAEREPVAEPCFERGRCEVYGEEEKSGRYQNNGRAEAGAVGAVGVELSLESARFGGALAQKLIAGWKVRPAAILSPLLCKVLCNLSQ